MYVSFFSRAAKADRRQTAPTPHPHHAPPIHRPIHPLPSASPPPPPPPPTAATTTHHHPTRPQSPPPAVAATHAAYPSTLPHRLPTRLCRPPPPPPPLPPPPPARSLAARPRPPPPASLGIAQPPRIVSTHARPHTPTLIRPLPSVHGQIATLQHVLAALALRSKWQHIASFKEGVGCSRLDRSIYIIRRCSHRLRNIPQPTPTLINTLPSSSTPISTSTHARPPAQPSINPQPLHAHIYGSPIVDPSASRPPPPTSRPANPSDITRAHHCNVPPFAISINNR